MELKVYFSILIIGLVAIFLNYEVKMRYCDFKIVAKGALIGFVLSTVLSVCLRKNIRFKNNLLLIPKNGPFVHNHIYFWIGGLYLGMVSGYNWSIIENILEIHNSFKFMLLFSHCTLSYGTIVVLFFADVIRPIRDLFPVIYGKRLRSIKMQELIGLLPCAFIMGEYVSTLCLAYIGFFITIYYCIYLAYYSNPFRFLIGLGLFCFINVVVNTFRYFYILPKLRKMNEEQDFRDTFSQIVV
ncbi:hypothetical protein SteCoe_36442 [Stentor coeruleus]|uniref:Uncharacterized protein n=1 Tax=Stentor coeruleus TaxID=5963 RepID=A0A1R2AQ24_9CILI|nr:hypothetical protein SteCoe_36442 [Stentor coeruleus]